MEAKSGVRSIGIQTSVPFREYVGPKERAAQAPEFFKEGWMHRPRTVSTLCLFLTLVFVLAQVLAGSQTTARERLACEEEEEGTSSPSLRVLLSGVLAAACMFVVFGSLQLPDGLLVRPTPFVWRFVKSCSVLYLMSLVFLLFQELGDVRSWLHSLDPQSGVPIDETNYADECDLSALYTSILEWMQAQEKIDIFVVAHFGGWFVKALVIRDPRLLWVLSVLFEIAEISLRHILPNFWECWWDHLLLDVFGCNMLGIYLGLYTCRKLQVRHYNWHRSYSASLSRMGSALRLTRPAFPLSPKKQLLRKQESLEELAAASAVSDVGEVSAFFEVPSSMKATQVSCVYRTQPVSPPPPSDSGSTSRSKWKTAFVPLTPYELRKYTWPGMLSSARSFVGLALFCLSVTMLDLNVFFLKAELYMAPSHPIILARTALIACAAAAGTSEFYAFLTDERCIRMGVQCWIDLAIIATEALLAFKWYYFEGALQPHAPCPEWIKTFWMVTSAILLTVVTALSFVSPTEATSSCEQEEPLRDLKPED